MRRLLGIVFVVMALVFSAAAVADRNDSSVGASSKPRTSAADAHAMTVIDVALVASAAVVLVGLGFGLRRAARANSRTESMELAEPVEPAGMRHLQNWS